MVGVTASTSLLPYFRARLNCPDPAREEKTHLTVAKDLPHGYGHRRCVNRLMTQTLSGSLSAFDFDPDSDPDSDYVYEFMIRQPSGFAKFTGECLVDPEA
jgi:hypothetical protein